MDEMQKVLWDAKHFGTGFIKDGKRVDPREVFIGVDDAKDGAEQTIMYSRDLSSDNVGFVYYNEAASISKRAWKMLMKKRVKPKPRNRRRVGMIWRA